MEAGGVCALKKSKQARVKALSAEEEARRREAIRQTLREKLELEQRALKVVESLIEENITEDFLLECACFITPANYKDVVEERSISKLCGYPVCLNKLSKVPSQQYKISTKTNKVYDITERKCFCSNFCYKASKQFELQISKTPLWLRKHESTPPINLLKRGESGSFGEEVLLSDRRLQEDDIENPAVAEPSDPLQQSTADLPSHSDGSDDEKDQEFVSSVVSQKQKPKVHWGDLPKRSDNDNKKAKNKIKHEDAPSQKEDQNDGTDEKSFINKTDDNGNEKTPFLNPSGEEKEVEVATGSMEKLSLQTHSEGQSENITTEIQPENSAPCCDSGLNIIQMSMSKRGAAGLRNLLKNYCAEVKLDSIPMNLLKCLRTTITEWATDETLSFLYGEEFSKKNKDNVDEEELDEDDVDVDEVTEEKRKASEEGTPSGATPDYDTLKREAELMQLQVREFYKGTWVLPEQDSDKVSQRETPLPLVDSKAQHVIQKRITVEKLTSCLKVFVGPLGLTMSDVIGDLNNLVRTFRFTNKNIIHKTPEWTLIAVVLLHMLSEVSPVILEALKTTSSVEYLQALMEELGLQEQDLLSLVQMLKPH